MAEFQFNKSGPAPKKPIVPKAPSVAISCRATNPLSLQDDLGKVFLDEHQAKATTATRLFRNDELFDAMTKVVIPAFLAANRTGKFSMWSTGCSSGEEVYSMAMIALNEFEKNRRSAALEAFGTDINQNRIDEAVAGVYGLPSKDSLSQGYWRLLQKHATLEDRAVHMGDALRTVCRFRIFDMRNRPKKHVFHFIVCNHVFQYYDAPGQQHIIANLKAVLRPGGHLYLEGITQQGLEGGGLRKLPNTANLYTVDDKGTAHSPSKR